MLVSPFHDCFKDAWLDLLDWCSYTDIWKFRIHIQHEQLVRTLLTSIRYQHEKSTFKLRCVKREANNITIARNFRSNVDEARRIWHVLVIHIIAIAFRRLEAHNNTMHFIALFWETNDINIFNIWNTRRKQDRALRMVLYHACGSSRREGLNRVKYV
jgi:hypothetical protein